VASGNPGEVTALLRAWHGGDEGAYSQVCSLLYTELRRQAARRMRSSDAGKLEATSLVHETFLRLANAHQVDWQDRNHFLAVAARTMRRVLVDLVREQGAAKRGSRVEHVPLDSGLEAGGPSSLDLIALDRALEALAARDARKVQVVELKFFAGLTVEEIAAVLRVSSDTIARDWRLARTWLLRELTTTVR
jgi:RNA polymerase sigma factor (TIGR02999 family)